MIIIYAQEISTMKKMFEPRLLLFCSLAITLNVILSEVVVLMNIPFLFLDALGTIFIASNFNMRYGVLTGFCTNTLTRLLTSPLAFPFVTVNILIAILVNLFVRKGFTYPKAVGIGIVVALLTSIISTPISLFLFDGMTNSVVDILILSLRSAGKSLFTSAYWGDGR